MPNYENNVESAIRLIQSIPQDGPIELCYSGGKDSDVILELAKMAGVDVVPIYKQTTIDPPGTTAHVKAMGVEIRRPKETFFQLMERKGCPSMFKRFCCEVLKEYKIHDRAIIGIRRCESPKRERRYTEPEQCRVYPGGSKVRQYYPILNWTDYDVERFIKERGLKCAPVYYDDNGRFHVERRLGCVGCPLSKKGAREDFKKYPRMLNLWARSIRRFREKHPGDLFRDEYDELFFSLFCKDKRDFDQRINIPVYPVGCDDTQAFRERYFGISPLDSPKFPDDRFKMDTKLFLQDYFGTEFE